MSLIRPKANTSRDWKAMQLTESIIFKGFTKLFFTALITVESEKMDICRAQNSGASQCHKDVISQRFRWKTEITKKHNAEIQTISFNRERKKTVEPSLQNTGILMT